jgi:hypothetical protein
VVPDRDGRGLVLEPDIELDIRTDLVAGGFPPSSARGVLCQS